MSVSVNYTSKLSTDEVLSINADHQDATQTVTSKLNTSLTQQGASSTPPCTLRAGADLALVSGAATLDLTALTGVNGAAVNGNSLRAQFIKFVNGTSNANSMTISKGSSNGYTGLGSAFSITLVPGAEALFRLNDGGSDIGGSNKNLDVSGTGAQVLSHEIIMG